MVYDVSNPESLKKVRDWVKELNKMLGVNKVRICIIGNKLDLLPAAEQRSPQTNALIREAMQYTNELVNARHHLTSAKYNLGLADLFVSLSRRMIEQHKRLLETRMTSLASSRSGLNFGVASKIEDIDDDYSLGGQYGRHSAISLGNVQRGQNEDDRSCRCFK